MKYQKILLIIPVLIFVLITQSTSFSQSAKKTKSETHKQDISTDGSGDNCAVKSYIELEEYSYEDIPFVNDEVIKVIRETYSNINFRGEFKKGNTESYNFYISQFYRLINCEATFFDKTTKKEYYINNFNEMDYSNPGMHLICGGEYSDIYDPNNYIYYFFDMDSDGTPELCITDEIRFIYIMKYDSDSNKFVLWHEIPSTWIRLLGSGELWFYNGGSPTEYAYYYLNKDGEYEYSVSFYIDNYYNRDTNENETVFMLSLFECADSNNSLFTESIRNNAVFSERLNVFLFKLTEKQWSELTNEFFESRNLAKEKINEVKYTYTELFG